MAKLDYTIRDGLVIDSTSGAYRFGVEKTELRRFTVFVKFTIDADESDGFVEIEEIDVDATDEIQARDVAGRALEADYESGGSIYRVEERFGWYL